MKLLRVLIQKMYYYKFYIKVQIVGKNIKLSSGGKFIHPEEITMGSNIFISNNFHISACALKIGSDIMIGPNLVIECTNHKSNLVGQKMFEVSNDKKCSGITIEDDVWIGANVVLLPGVTIAEGCVVGAASVVTRNLPPYTICVGAPCRPIKKRFSDIEMMTHLSFIKTSKYHFEEISNQWKSYNL